MSPTVLRFPDAAALTSAAAAEIARRIGNGLAVAPDARFSIGLAGGNTPRPVYEALATADGIDWNRVHVFWSDERYVPHDSPESNYRMARETLLDRIAIPAANIHPIPTSLPDPAAAARDYERILDAFFGSPFPALDLSILGMGNDGHTASLFPGSASLRDRDRAVVAVRAPAAPPDRISMTIPALEGARATLFIIAGAAKREILREILDDPGERYPAGMIRPRGEVVWMVEDEG